MNCTQALEAELEQLRARVECAHCGFVWLKGEEPKGHECSMNPLVIERDSLRLRVEALRLALLLRGVSDAPCDICGYCGSDYYQPGIHRCIGEAYEARRAARNCR